MLTYITIYINILCFKGKGNMIKIEGLLVRDN